MQDLSMKVGTEQIDNQGINQFFSFFFIIICQQPLLFRHFRPISAFSSLSTNFVFSPPFLQAKTLQPNPIAITFQHHTPILRSPSTMLHG